jgi:hypothetical protein
MKYLHVSREPVANQKKEEKREKGIEEITHNLHYHWKGDGTDVLFGNYG